jgi:23S rRNA (cytosine1962-C5)-methyltransferase
MGAERRAGPPAAAVSARGRARIVEGHPWIFRQDILSGPSKDAGEPGQAGDAAGPPIVLVTDQRGTPLAWATWAARARIGLRVLERFGIPGLNARGEPTPEPRRERDLRAPGLLDFVARRLAAARARRGGIGREAYRLAHGEADGVPGLFVDVYGDAAVMQTTSVAMDAHRAALGAHLLRDLGARIVVERDDGSTRDFEGLPRRTGVLAGAGPTRVVYRLGHNDLEADLLTDGKTGGFLDQADNHAAVAALAPRGASALDAFTYHGGFALALARRGGRVLATDEDPDAVARAAANAARNGLLNLEVRRANAFDLLRQLEGDRARFDVVVLDPPAFGKRQGGAAAADRAYHELILRGLRLTAPGGLCVACSCSGQISREHFDDLVARAAAASGAHAQIVERRGPSQDFPELVGVPETAYLKCWILRVL